MGTLCDSISAEPLVFGRTLVPILLYSTRAVQPWDRLLARVLAPPSEERGFRQDQLSFCLPGSYGKNMSLLNSSPVSSLDQFDGPLI